MRVAPTFLPVSRTSSGHLTSCTQPSFSTSQMPRAAMSIWPLNTPCLAHVGSAWCRLCQDSPNESTASQATFLDLSLASNSRLPNVWQIELIDHVTWCRNDTRTKPAQKRAISAPCHDMVQKPTISAGATKVTATRAGNILLTRLMSLSASQSGENFLCDVTFLSNSQPMCAHTRPLVRAFRSVPNRQGECGSPSLSLYLWCLRWSETQLSIGPSSASVPAMPSTILKV